MQNIQGGSAAGLTCLQQIMREHDKMLPGLGNFSAEDLGMTDDEFRMYVKERNAN